MFDENMFSQWQSASDTGSVIVTFFDRIKLKKVSITARVDCCQERYKGICLYVDETKVVCKANDFIPQGGQTIEFSTSINGNIIEVKFPNGHAQIPELWIDYEIIPATGL